MNLRKTYVILGFCRDNVFFPIVHGLRVIVFGFPKKNLQYFERRVRHLAFFQGINRLPYILLLLLGLTQEKHYSACILDGFGVIFLSSCQVN